MKRVINWFEIPVADFERAVGFYQKVFGVTLTREEMGNCRMAVFPYQCPNASGALCQASHLRPGSDGTLIYLDAGEDVAMLLERVTANGGTIAQPKMLISEKIGHIGVFVDTEGNRVGVHAEP